MSAGFTHAKCSLALKDIMMLVVTGQSLLKNRSHPTAGDPELTEEQGDHDGHEGELDGRVLAPLYSNADRRFRKWECVALVLSRRRDESDITAVELAALHLELAVDPRRWFVEFAVEKH